MTVLRSMLIGTAAHIVSMANTDQGTPRANRRTKSVYTDSDGEKLLPDDTAGMAEAYRDAVNEDRDSDIDLSDDEIVAILRSIPGDETHETNGPAVRAMRLEALAKAADKDQPAGRVLEDLSKPISAVTSRNAALAYKFGAQIDKATDALLKDTADNQEKVTGAPIMLAVALCTLWGGERDPKNGYIVRCPAVDTMPVPNTRQKDAPPQNRPFDRYIEWDNAAQKDRNGHFMADMVDSTPSGSENRQRLADLALLSTDGFSEEAIVHKEYLTAEYKTNVSGCRESEIERLRTRRNTSIKAMGKAIGFLQVVNILHRDFAKNVSWGFTVPNGGNALDIVAKKNRPVRLATSYGGPEAAQLKPWSLSQFNSLQLKNKDGKVRLDVAFAKGGTLTNINDTMKRAAAQAPGQGGGADKSGEKQKLLLSPAQMEAAASAVVMSFEEPGFEAALYLSLNRGGDEVIRNFVEASYKWYAVAQRYQPRYDAIVKAQTDAENKARIEAAGGTVPTPADKTKVA